jgi:hypothetical protein
MPPSAFHVPVRSPVAIPPLRDFFFHSNAWNDRGEYCAALAKPGGERTGSNANEVLECVLSYVFVPLSFRISKISFLLASLSILGRTFSNWVRAWLSFLFL